MQINVGEKIRIASDKRQWAVYRAASAEWRPLYYYQSLQCLVDWIKKDKELHVTAGDLRDLVAIAAAVEEGCRNIEMVLANFNLCRIDDFWEEAMVREESARLARRLCGIVDEDKTEPRIEVAMIGRPAFARIDATKLQYTVNYFTGNAPDGGQDLPEESDAVAGNWLPEHYHSDIAGALRESFLRKVRKHPATGRGTALSAIGRIQGDYVDAAKQIFGLWGQSRVLH
jgi:hypothetical protein